MTEDIDVKCVNSKTLTTTIRTVFAAYLWHYGAVHDAMAAAAYIKFEHNDPQGFYELIILDVNVIWYILYIVHTTYYILCTTLCTEMSTTNV